MGLSWLAGQLIWQATKEQNTEKVTENKKEDTIKYGLTTLKSWDDLIPIINKKYEEKSKEDKTVRWDEINIFGIRCKSKNNLLDDDFKDYIGVVTQEIIRIDEDIKFGSRTITKNNLTEKGTLIPIGCYIFKGTTEPGAHWIKQGMSYAARLHKGFYKNIWMVHFHNQKVSDHPALCLRQGVCPSVKAWRDIKPDGTYIPDAKDHPIWYERTFIDSVNLHRATIDKVSQKIGEWSQACQVIQNYNEFNALLTIVMKSSTYKKAPRLNFLHNTEIKKALFSYMLFDEDDLINTNDKAKKIIEEIKTTLK